MNWSQIKSVGWRYQFAPCFAVLYACANNLPADGDPPPSAAPALVSAELHEISAADWELASGEETYVCVRQVLPQALFVNAWRPMIPAGTHHAVLAQSPEPDGVADGVSKCTSATLGTRNLMAAAVGTNDQVMPDGVAMELKQGSQLILNLHLFNATDQPLRGRSGAWARTVAPGDIRMLADSVLAGPIKLEVPPGRSTSRGTCTFNQDATLFGIGPHMHQTGVAMHVIAHSIEHGDVVLFDGPFDFEEQRGYPIDMLRLKAGDTVDVACTFENPSAQTLNWGSSSNDEMCSANLARFPAVDGPSLCIQ